MFSSLLILTYFSTIFRHVTRTQNIFSFPITVTVNILSNITDIILQRLDLYENKIEAKMRLNLSQPYK